MEARLHRRKLSRKKRYDDEKEGAGGEEREGEGGSREEGGSLPVAGGGLRVQDGALHHKSWLRRRTTCRAGQGGELEVVVTSLETLSKRLPSVKRNKWKAAVQKTKQAGDKNVESEEKDGASLIPSSESISKETQIPRGENPKGAETLPQKLSESPKSEKRMAWRRNYYLRSQSPSPPAQPVSSKTDPTEPNWVKVLGSSASQVWSMVKTFRERGNHEIAASLEAAAEKQAEAVLKTQQINVRQAKTPSSPVPVAKPIVSREPTPMKSPVRVRVRRSAASSPVPSSSPLEEEEKRSSRAESEWESEEEETSSRPPSGAMMLIMIIDILVLMVALLMNGLDVPLYRLCSFFTIAQKGGGGSKTHVKKIQIS